MASFGVQSLPATRKTASVPLSLSFMLFIKTSKMLAATAVRLNQLPSASFRIGAPVLKFPIRTRSPVLLARMTGGRSCGTGMSIRVSVFSVTIWSRPSLMCCRPRRAASLRRRPVLTKISSASLSRVSMGHFWWNAAMSPSADCRKPPVLGRFRFLIPADGFCRTRSASDANPLHQRPSKSYLFYLP